MGVLVSLCPRKDEGVREAKSLGLSLSIVRGRSLTIRTASEVKVCSSTSEGLRQALSKMQLKAF